MATEQIGLKSRQYINPSDGGLFFGPLGRPVLKRVRHFVLLQYLLRVWTKHISGYPCGKPRGTFLECNYFLAFRKTATRQSISAQALGI